MVKIVITAPAGHSTVAHVQGEEALIDVCDEIAAPVPFSCRSTTCGTCGVWVEQGAECLSPPTEEERALQAKLGRDGQRFACAIRVRTSNGVVRLRVSGSGAT
jgi:ferredoxin